MGKIIEFKPRVLNNVQNTDGVNLYYKYYKTASELEKTWIEQLIRMEFHGNSFIKRISPQDVLELYGYTAAKRHIKQTWATVAYYKKIAEIIEKYGIEVLENVKTN